jgi:sugar/nucleoside kinase (ribokinase family)
MNVDHDNPKQRAVPVGLGRLRQEGMPRRFAVTVIGDIRVEVRGILPSARFADVERDLLVFAPLSLKISGTAVNVATAAVDVFARTTVIARIGDDALTAAIRAHLEALGASSHLVVDPDIGNGLVVLIRDQDPSRLAGVRLLISGDPAPSHRLSPDDVRAYKGTIEASDLLLLDGYSLLSPCSRSAVVDAARIARDAGVQVGLDLLPHDLDNYLGLDDIKRHIALADYVIVEARTLSRTLLQSSADPFATRDLPGLLARINADFDRRHVWLLRFGLGDIDESLIYANGRIYCYEVTGYASEASADRVGFGDRLSMVQLAQLLAIGS